MHHSQVAYKLTISLIMHVRSQLGGGCGGGAAAVADDDEDGMMGYFTRINLL